MDAAAGSSGNRTWTDASYEIRIEDNGKPFDVIYTVGGNGLVTEQTPSIDIMEADCGHPWEYRVGRDIVRWVAGDGNTTAAARVGTNMFAAEVELDVALDVVHQGRVTAWTSQGMADLAVQTPEGEEAWMFLPDGPVLLSLAGDAGSYRVSGSGAGASDLRILMQDLMPVRSPLDILYAD